MCPLLKKSGLLLVLLCLLPVSLSAKKQYLRINDFRVADDELSQTIGHHFWRIFCEQLTQNRMLRLVATKDQIRERGNFAPGIHRIPDVLVHPDSTGEKTAFLPIRGAIKLVDSEYQFNLKIGEQASDSGSVAWPRLNDWSQTRADLNRIVSQVLRQLRPEFNRQLQYFGMPLDPKKFHILIADFAAADSLSAQTAAAQFQKQLLTHSEHDSCLQTILDVRRLPAARAQIKNESDALEIGKLLDVDVIVSGSLHFSSDSLFRTTRVCLANPAHKIRYLRTDVLQATQAAAADSTLQPEPSLVHFILAWAYLNHLQEKNDTQTLRYLDQALISATPENRQNLLLLAASIAGKGIDDGKLQFYVRQFAPSDSFAVACGHLFRGDIFKKNEQPDSARKYYLNASELFSQLQLDENQAQVYYSLGKFYMENDNADSAAFAFQKSADLYAATKKEIECAIVCSYLGAMYQKNKAFAQAEAVFQNAIQIFLEKDQRSSLATLYKYLGILYYQQGKNAQALVCYKKLIEIGVEIGDRDDLAANCQYIGAISYKMGLLEQSLEFFEKYISFTSEDEHPEYLGKTYSYLGFLYNKKGYRERSRENFRHAINVFRANRDTSQLAATFASLGRVHFSWEDFQQAENYLQKSAALLKATGDLSQLASVCKSLGALHYQQGNPAQALGYYQTARNLWREVGDSTELATTYQSMALIHFQQGKAASAIKFYQKSAAIHQARCDSNGLVTNLSNIGRIFYQQSEWDSARVYFEQAVEICTKTGLTAGLSTLYQYLGICWFNLGEPARRLEFYEKAAAVSQQEGDFTEQARLCVSIGMIHRNNEAFETALKYFQKAVEIYGAETPDLATVYQNIGYVYFEQEQWDRALDYLLSARDGFVEASDLKKLMEVYFLLSKIYPKFGDSFGTREASYKYNAIFNLLNEREALYVPYHKLALLNLKQRKFEDAEAYARLALQEVELSRKFNFRILEKTTLVQIFLVQKKYDEAISLLEKAFAPESGLDYSHPENSKNLLLEAQLGASLELGHQFPELSEFLATAPALEQARLFSKVGVWRPATKHYRTFLYLAADTLNAPLRAQVQTEIATCFLKQNQADSALSYLQPAQAFFQQSRDSLMLAQVQAQIGAVYKIQKKWPKALVSLRRSQQLHWQIAGGPNPELGETLFHLADVFHQTAQPDSASIYAWKSLEFAVRAEDAEKVFPVQDLLERIDAVAKK